MPEANAPWETAQFPERVATGVGRGVEALEQHGAGQVAVGRTVSPCSNLPKEPHKDSLL